MLDVYGSLLYAGARTLQDRLPDPPGSTQPVVVLRLAGSLSLGATFAAVIADYAARLDRVGGHLILAGVQSPTLTKIERTVMAKAGGRVEVFEASTVIGESTNLAIDAGLRWLDEHPPVSRRHRRHPARKRQRRHARRTVGRDAVTSVRSSAQSR